jgi:glycosyltransferase involved in cell wall biosynthesis
MTERVLIAIPCYNEAGSIADLLSEVARHHSLSDVVVIDDGSEDGTAHRLPSVVRCVRADRNEGVGHAVRRAVQVAWDEGYDYVVRLDGDGQHPPDQISILFNHHRLNKSNVVVGSRFGGSEKPDRSGYCPSWDRRFGIWVVRKVLRAFFGITVGDPTSGFQLMDRKAMAHVLRQPPALFPEPVGLARASGGGLAVSETRVRMRPRRHGASSIAGWKKISFLPRVLWDLARVRERHPR